MSVAYSRLSKGFADHGANGPVQLPADGRALKQWLDNLPRGNPKGTAVTLQSALAAHLQHAQSGNSRFNQLEQLRETVLDTVLWLERQFMGSPLPMTADRLQHAQSAQALNNVLADNYRLACHELCAPEGSIGLLKSGAVTTALERATWHYQQCLLQSWSLYRGAPPSIWLGLHRVYQFAASVNVDTKTVTEPVAKKALSVRTLYIESCLLSLMNPFAFAHRELDLMKALAFGLADSCRIRPDSKAEYTASLPIDADLPVDAELPEGEAAGLDFSALQQALVNAEYAPDGEQVLVRIPAAGKLELPLSVLKRTLRNFGLAAARLGKRIPSDYTLQTVCGLSSVHFFAAGQMDFERYTQKISQQGSQGLSLAADWLSMSSDGQSPRSLPAQVIDHSLGGYLLRWSPDPALRIRVGEVVGLNAMPASNEPDWMLGVVRWLRYENDGSILAGIKLLARRCLAVALRVHTDGHAGSLVRGLELQALEQGAASSFLWSGKSSEAEVRVDAHYGYEPYRLTGPRTTESLMLRPSILSSNMDYTLLVVPSEAVNDAE